MEREYRVLHNGEQLAGWTSDFDLMATYAENMRNHYPRGEITIEISPWSWNDKVATCPGCEYLACPVGSKK